MIDPRTTEVGDEFRHLGRKVHVVGVCDDGAWRIVTFKHWMKFRWNYESERESYFLHVTEPRYRITEAGRKHLEGE